MVGECVADQLAGDLLGSFSRRDLQQYLVFAVGKTLVPLLFFIASEIEGKTLRERRVDVATAVRTGKIHYALKGNPVYICLTEEKLSRFDRIGGKGEHE